MKGEKSNAVTDLLAAYISVLAGTVPGFVFVLSAVRSHHGLAHFGWSFGTTGGPPAASGLDIVVIEQGRIGKIYGFFDKRGFGRDVVSVSPLAVRHPNEGRAVGIGFVVGRDGGCVSGESGR